MGAGLGGEIGVGHIGNERLLTGINRLEKTSLSNPTEQKRAEEGSEGMHCVCRYGM